MTRVEMPKANETFYKAAFKLTDKANNNVRYELEGYNRNTDFTGIRNLLTAAKILAELDPEVLEHVSKAMTSATEDYKREQKPPSLFQLAKRANSEDSRRGLSFMTLILSSLGRSLKS